MLFSHISNNYGLWSILIISIAEMMNWIDTERVMHKKGLVQGKIILQYVCQIHLTFWFGLRKIIPSWVELFKNN